MAGDVNKPSSSVQNRKKRKGNSFKPLSDYDGMSEDEILETLQVGKTSKLPPVIICGDIKYETIKAINNKTESEVVVKCRRNRSQVYTKSLSDYNKALDFAKSLNYEHYTYTQRELKQLKMVLKNISPTITENEIKEELLLKNFNVIKVVQMIRKNNNQTGDIKLPLFIITFEAGTVKSKVYKVKYVCSCAIQWSVYVTSCTVL